MRGYGLIIVFVVLPFLAALGHDCYLFYLNHATNGFDFATFGYIWTHYHLESYKQAVTTLDTETWGLIDNFLQYEATFVTGAFLAIVLLVSLVMRLLGFGKDDGVIHGSGKSIDKILNRGKKTGGFKYNRK